MQTRTDRLDERTADMVRDWLRAHHGDRESLARWMRDSLRIGGIKVCRALIAQAAQS